MYCYQTTVNLEEENTLHNATSIHTVYPLRQTSLFKENVQMHCLSAKWKYQMLLGFALSVWKSLAYKQDFNSFSIKQLSLINHQPLTIHLKCHLENLNFAQYQLVHKYLSIRRRVTIFSLSWSITVNLTVNSGFLINHTHTHISI